MRSANSVIPQTSRLETDVEKAWNRLMAQNFRFGTFIIIMICFVASPAVTRNKEVRRIHLLEICYFPPHLLHGQMVGP